MCTRRRLLVAWSICYKEHFDVSGFAGISSVAWKVERWWGISSNLPFSVGCIAFYLLGGRVGKMEFARILLTSSSVRECH